MDKEELGMIIFLIIIITIIIIALITTNKQIYIYEDYNGKIGIADSCLSSDKSILSGGLGTLTCKIIDENKTVQVKWYKIVNKKQVQTELKKLKEEGKNNE